MYYSMDLESNLTIKENMNTMLVATSALSVCTELNLSYAKFSLFDFIFHMFEVGFWSKIPYFADPHPQCSWLFEINGVLL